MGSKIFGNFTDHQFVQDDKKQTSKFHMTFDLFCSNFHNILLKISKSMDLLYQAKWLLNNVAVRH